MAAPAQLSPRSAAKPKQVDDSLFDELLSAGGSSLQYVGETLNKPSRALWGSLNYLSGGNSGGGLLNLVPFSDATGLTNPRKGIEAADFLENQGVLPANTPGFDWIDPVRFGANVAGDPLSWVSGVGLLKSLGKGGSVLSKADKGVKGLSRVGRMTTTVRQAASQVAPDALQHAATRSGFNSAADFLSRHGDEAVGGLLSLNKGPLGGPIKAFGTGKLAQKVGGALDKLGDAARYSAPGRLGAALFSRQNRGALTETGQKLAQTAHAGERAAGVAAREAFAPHLRSFEEFAQTLPNTAARLDAHDAFRAAVEDTSPLPQTMAHLQPDVDAVRKFNADQLAMEQSEGLVSTELDDLFADYNRRQRFFFPGDKSKSEFPSLLLSGKHGSQNQRSDILRDLQGGTSLINRLSVDPKLSGVVHGMKPAQLNKAFWDQQERLVNAAMSASGNANWTYEHSRALARWLGDLDPRHVTENVPVFPHNPIEEATKRSEIGGRAVEMARAIRETIGQKGNNFTSDNAPANAVRASEVFANAGLDPQKSLDLLQEGFRGRPATVLREGADLHKKYGAGADDYAKTTRTEADDLNRRMVEMAEQAGGLEFVEGTPEFDDLVRQWEHANNSASAARGIAGSAREVASDIKTDLNDVWIPKELAEDIGRVLKSFRQPDEVGKVLKYVDKFTALFKTGVTAMAPAFHVRNRTSGAVQNWMIGAFSARSANDADKLIRGRGAIKGLQELGGAYKGLTDDQATRKFAEELFAQDVAPRGQGIGLESLTGTTLDRNLAADIPGIYPNRLRDAFSSALPRNLRQSNPLNVSGVATETDVFAPAVAGRQLGSLVEAQNRIEGYLELRRQGYAPERAAERIRQAHVDYSNLSDTERQVRRWVPFMAFSKGMAEFVADELLQRPGGRLGQTIRASNQRSDEPMPDYVGQTAAIPLGTLPDGSQRFLTGFGLAHEDSGNLIGFRGGMPDLGGTLAELGSRLNPLLKYPIEAATGESLFQRGPLGGRDILDQDPTIGRLISNVSELAGAGPRELPSGRAKPFISQGFEQLASNLPTSRLMTTLRTLTDKRKLSGGPFPGSMAALNTLTGARVSDVSPAAQDALIRDELAALAREEGASAFESVRFSRKQIETAAKENPELAARMRALNAAAAELAARAKARKKAAR